MRRLRRLLVSALTGLLGATAGAGCQKALFPEGTPRTQYELHDRMRKQYAPATLRDEFGNERPAVRARLSQHRD